MYTVPKLAVSIILESIRPDGQTVMHIIIILLLVLGLFDVTL